MHQAPLSIDINQEPVAQALANTGAGLFQGMPVSTSLSASSLNDHSGAKTGLASLTSGLTVLLTLLLLAPLFSDLRKAVLAAVIIEAVVMGMMNISEMRRLPRVQRFDFWIAMTGIAATLVFGVLAGVMIGIALSPLWLIAVTTRPNIALLGREPGTQVYRDISNNPAPPRSISSPVLMRPICLARSLAPASTSAMKAGMAIVKKTISNTSSSVSTTPLLLEIAASHCNASTGFGFSTEAHGPMHGGSFVTGLGLPPGSPAECCEPRLCGGSVTSIKSCELLSSVCRRLRFRVPAADVLDGMAFALCLRVGAAGVCISCRRDSAGGDVSGATFGHGAEAPVQRQVRAEGTWRARTR